MLFFSSSQNGQDLEIAIQDGDQKSEIKKNRIHMHLVFNAKCQYLESTMNKKNNSVKN